MTMYARPGAEGSLMYFRTPVYDSSAGYGRATAARSSTPAGERSPFCRRDPMRPTFKALDAAHAAAPAWRNKPPAEQAMILDEIADRAEPPTSNPCRRRIMDNGEPVRETLNADIPLATNHSGISPGRSAQEGSLARSSSPNHRPIAFPRTSSAW